MHLNNLAILSLLTLTTIPAFAEHIIWQKQPIQISLPVGKERLISFEQAVSFGYDTNSVSNNALRIQNDNKTLYLLAKQPFSTQRMQAKLADGHVVLLDINATPNAIDEAIEIVLPQQTAKPQLTASVNNGNNTIALMRFAIQQLYAPTRLLTASSGITRYPMATNHLVPLVYDDSVSAMPLVSWRDSKQYVTAILLKNHLPTTLHVTPDMFCGNWQASSVYPLTRLFKHGAPGNQDTTTAFVMSKRPFAEAIKPCYAGD